MGENFKMNNFNNQRKYFTNNLGFSFNNIFQLTLVGTVAITCDLVNI